MFAFAFFIVTSHYLVGYTIFSKARKGDVFSSLIWLIAKKITKQTEIKRQFAMWCIARLIKRIPAGSLFLVNNVLHLAQLPQPRKLECLLVLAIH